ncbi:acylphosphatase [Lentilactobacillus sp. Marseille-Q4993]|uniref:acylphosphatase n=1 Tax=Lentilactobacillus sp. Marseille-Q4993 TaxID=3039492 RepID=UPI0024BC975C|nr:acylphosphatase [Lentilactobacillus sp. Marseille-Q4993]
MATKTVNIIVSGRVQGVGFRYATIKLANRLKINGWVKNNLDGSVEILANGDEPSLQSFISAVKKSPTPYGKVTNVDITETSINPGFGFDAKY